jgi:hypothetical protein
MAVTGNTQLGATKQDLIAALVQKELKFQAKLINTVSDVSAFAVKGSKSISFPLAGSFTVENRASATAGTIQDLTFAKEQLDLNYRAYIGWTVDSVDEYQSNVDVQAEYIKRASTAHARNLDEQVLTILNARKWLLKNQAVLSDCTMVVNPDDESLLLAIPEFVRADAYGNSNIPSGVIGKIYGLNVMIHSKPDLAKSFIFEKSAVAFGLQKAPQYDEQKDIRYGTGSMLAAIDQLFGFKALQLGQGLTSAGAPLAGTASPLIAEIG